MPDPYIEPRCKVCTSPKRLDYENAYFESEGQLSWQELERRATENREEISYKAFERHFTNPTHYSTEVMDYLRKEAGVVEVAEKAKEEVINIVEEIKTNLNGLKTLLSKTLDAYEGKTLSPGMLRVVTEIYREHRQSLEACDRLTSSLTSKTNLSEAEILKILYEFAKDFCPECTTKFKNNLDAYLKRKGTNA